ncbi:tyrosine-type recombinase/integrase [Neoaquamicrobium sediminum]|uniref:tyrosine-type recombinase/integrase n=1 Tax=Neoaquamicrobium sediminum TaxID=1849104 RepID=UPI003BA8449D
MPLTDIAVRNAKPGDRLRKLADSGNLYLAVAPTGTKSWRMDYSYLGRRKTLSLGTYPATTLAEAREKRDAARRVLEANKDPAVVKRREKMATLAANGNTFGVIADEFLDKLARDGRARRTIKKNTWMLNELASPLRSYPITEISAKDVLGVLSSIEKSGRVESALATRATIGRVFRYAIATARAESDPTSALRGALQRHVPRNHSAITDINRLGGLMRAIYGYEGWPSLCAALKIQAFCFARPSETRTMTWTELDIDKAVWTIPAEKAKMRRPHEVPLSRQALEVLDEMKVIFGQRQQQVFPSMMSGKKVLSENSMNSALRRMGFTADEHTAHGFRATASTILNGSGLFGSDAIEAQLAHLDTREVRRVYNRASYWEDRVKMMQWWADLLDEKRLAKMP